MTRPLKILSILALAGLSLQVFGLEIPEYNLKAAYLYNLGKFVTWPVQAFQDAKSPLLIGILGKDPFGDVLDQTVDHKILQGRGVLVARFPSFERSQATALGHCHILFISRSEKTRVPEILQALAGRPVLTVSEIEDFLPAGGIVFFTQKDNRLSLKINRKAAQKCGLEMGAKLLSLFEIYE